MQIPLADLRFRRGAHSYERALKQTPYKVRCENPEVAHLLESLRSRGQVNPLVVYEMDGLGTYEVRLGSQRLACMRVLGWGTARCVVMPRTGGSREHEQFLKHYSVHSVWSPQRGCYVDPATEVEVM